MHAQEPSRGSQDDRHDADTKKCDLAQRFMDSAAEAPSH
jgi:hypothetical protein